MNSIMRNFFTGTAIGCTASILVYCGRHLRSNLKRKRSFSNGQKAFHLDRLLVNAIHECECCGGENTRLRMLKTGQFLCADRKLCRETMIAQNKLESMEESE